jgi:hypothetical protein
MWEEIFPGAELFIPLVVSAACANGEGTSSGEAEGL